MIFLTKPYPNNFCYMRWSAKETYRIERLNSFKKAKKDKYDKIQIGKRIMKIDTAISFQKRQMSIQSYW